MERAPTLAIGVAQLRPVWLDAARTTGQILGAIERAANAGVEVLAFGETFLGGYPFWLSPADGARFNDPVQKECYRRYREAAVSASGKELRAIREAASDLGILVLLGFAERGEGAGGGTIWCSSVFLDPQTGMGPIHRKLVPTHEERLVWGAGDGHGLRVHSYKGWRLSTLSCWENWMPLARFALLAQGPDLHFSLWPGSVSLTSEITSFVAREGRMWHCAASALLDRELIPPDFPLRDAVPEDHIYDGGTAIARPDGRWALEPRAREEGLLSFVLDAAIIDRERQTFDPAGHYHRSELFDFSVDRRRRLPAEFRD